MAPKPRWQWRAKLLILLGGAISGPLVFVALGIAGELIGSIALPFGPGDRRAWGLLFFVVWVGGFLLALLPALALGSIAARLPKLLKVKCRNCGWSASFMLSRRDVKSTAREEATSASDLDDAPANRPRD